MMIEGYLLSNNPQAVADALKAIGSPPVKDKGDLINKLNFAGTTMPDKLYPQLAKIHTPYRDLILTEHEKEKSSIEGGGGLKSNCSGCPSVQVKSNADAATAPATTIVPVVKSEIMSHPVAIVGVVLIGLGVVVMILKK
jgi:hypothetical protein